MKEVRLEMDLSKAKTYCEIDAIRIDGTEKVTKGAIYIFVCIVLKVFIGGTSDWMRLIPD